MKALITGINGQDGAYLSSYLEGKGYDVIGIARKKESTDNLDYTKSSPRFYYGDVSEADFIDTVVQKEKPDEIYNLAAQSHVGYSFNNPVSTMSVNYGGLVNLINAVKKYKPNSRIYQAGTSEMFGGQIAETFTERSKFDPKSPYAIAKLAAHYAGVNARKEGIWVSNGILFNHESPIRGEDFVTRKITLAIARKHKLFLGNLNASRDWGFAGDYIKAMHSMLQYNKPDDFVVATNETYSVRDFVRAAYKSIGKEIRFEGHGAKEKGYIGDKCVLEVSDKFYRPNEVNYLRGDFSYAKSCLGWRPSVGFSDLVELMLSEDIRRYGKKNSSLHNVSI